MLKVLRSIGPKLLSRRLSETTSLGEASVDLCGLAIQGSGRLTGRESQSLYAGLPVNESLLGLNPSQEYGLRLQERWYHFI